MMNQLSAFINTLGIYDYTLFGGSLLLFILFLLLAIAVRKKPFFALLLIVLAFGIVIFTPILGHQKLHEIVFKNTLKINEVRKLEFTEALVIKGSLSNDSNLDFSACDITAGVYKVTGNTLLDILHPFRPFQKGSILTQPIPAGEAVEFKLFVEPFTYADEYNTTIGAQCR